MSMTWRQFKDLIDEQLQELGHSQEVEIEYIDITWPNSPEEGGKNSYRVPFTSARDLGDGGVPCISIDA